MIPNSDLFIGELKDVEYPSRTYKIEITEQSAHRMNGYVDDVEAIKQAIYLILNTERYEYIIYSWDYGVELVDLIGKPLPYVMSEIPRRVEEALTQDNRIESVQNFEFTKNKNKLHVTFIVTTNVGDFSTELEVTI